MLPSQLVDVVHLQYPPPLDRLDESARPVALLARGTKFGRRGCVGGGAAAAGWWEAARQVLPKLLAVGGALLERHTSWTPGLTQTSPKV